MPNGIGNLAILKILSIKSYILFATLRSSDFATKHEFPRYGVLRFRVAMVVKSFSAGMFALLTFIFVPSRHQAILITVRVKGIAAPEPFRR